jgi:hypothetical protein
MGFQVQAQVQDQEHQEQVKGKVSHFKIPSTCLWPSKARARGHACTERYVRAGTRINLPGGRLLHVKRGAFWIIYFSLQNQSSPAPQSLLTLRTLLNVQ